MDNFADGKTEIVVAESIENRVCDLYYQKLKEGKINQDVGRIYTIIGLVAYIVVAIAIMALNINVNGITLILAILLMFTIAMIFVSKRTLKKQTKNNEIQKAKMQIFKDVLQECGVDDAGKREILYTLYENKINNKAGWISNDLMFCNSLVAFCGSFIIAIISQIESVGGIWINDINGVLWGYLMLVLLLISIVYYFMNYNPTQLRYIAIRQNLLYVKFEEESNLL